jgi:hypothetical protein
MKAGVAIVLKDLISVLDQLSVEHVGEAALRRLLRKNKNVSTSDSLIIIGMSKLPGLTAVSIPASLCLSKIFQILSLKI